MARMDRAIVAAAACLLVTACSKRPGADMPANKNEVPPIAGDAGSIDLQQRAAALFAAVVADTPGLAEPFWFPQDPFLILKNVRDPAAYWRQLHDTYEDDIRNLHAQRASWAGTSFVGFDEGTSPKWMPPGGEHNHIGYYRSFKGHVQYAAPDGPASFEVAVLITWQGQWFVTHLREVEKKR